MTGIVVGIDGSESAAHALQWAEHEAELHAWPVTAVLAWGYLNQHHVDGDEFDPDYGVADARAALHAYVQQALGDDLREGFHQRVVNELPAPALLEAAKQASLLVVGARGRGGFKGMLLGSVSQQCVHHAPCPIAVLRPTAKTHPDEGVVPRVVVGIDGSEASRSALQWAVEEARARRAALEVVHAWSTPFVAGYPYVSAFDPDQFEAGARAAIETALEDIDTRGLAGPIERLTPLGRPAPVLIDASKGADLVVVGARGLGAFSGMLLGSVSHQLAQHAACPVIIVPPPD